ncbi:hypothetical protein M885DRAFT_515053 [Pelagophyceae sp. CCMP2097]|nr:hypothetical protein M885DRAFT_515053 [Pelagophyceae sp. CCMP2097]|mmetsp:Transcript_16908/g.57219  ORF Transcript_16908/g.57219 Transcript_16908/m.57219 type:complete len:199 (-) Transcript_16908:192-788(-)
MLQRALALLCLGGAAACWRKGSRERNVPAFNELDVRCPDWKAQFARGAPIVCDADCGAVHPRFELPVISAREGGRPHDFAICLPFNAAFDVEGGRVLGVVVDKGRLSRRQAPVMTPSYAKGLPERGVLYARRVGGSVVPMMDGARGTDVGQCLYDDALASLRRKCGRSADCRTAAQRLKTAAPLRRFRETYTPRNERR